MNRPQSAKFRKVAKPRIASAYKPQQPQPYNPWTTMYQEQTKTLDKRNMNTGAEQSRQPDFTDLISVKSAMSQATKNSKAVSNKENAQSKTTNNFFAQNTTKNLAEGQSVQKSSLKAKRPQTGKPQSRKNYSEVYDDVSVASQGEMRDNVSVTSGNLNKLEKTLNHIVKRPDNITNPLGQKETFLDPNDASSCPAHTRLITNANHTDFLKKNVHTLYSAPNEYYPLLGGECLCGYCICGNCKCVHMKFKNREQNAIGKTIHATDFPEYDMPFCNKQIIRPQQMQKPPNEFVKKSAYATDYPGHEPQADDCKFINKGKQNNLGPCASNVRAPVAKMTNHKLDYPDWGFVKPEPLNIAPLAPVKKIPGTFKTGNQDYGAFFNEEDAPAMQAPPKHIQKRSDNFFGPQLPMDYGTQHRADYTKKQTDGVDKRIPKDNLYSNNEKFDTKFRSIKQDYGDHPRALICPMKERVRLVKELIKTYAMDNRIPL